MIYGKINEQGLLERQQVKERIEKVAKEKVITFKDSTGEHQAAICEFVDSVITVEEQLSELEKDGWKPVAEGIAPDIECDEYERINEVPYDAGGRIEFNYEKVLNKERIRQKIAEVKQKLADTDYLVLKRFEAFIGGERDPLDARITTSRRQNLRDEINHLNFLLTSKQTDNQ
ncbi:MAG: hypothetical protein AAGU19_08840 [Prolixibacteraceae bacterium]